MTFVIEDGVPAPQGARYVTGATATARLLEVGQSFVVPSGSTWGAQVGGRLNTRLAPKRFTCRTIDGGVRVWRIA